MPAIYRQRFAVRAKKSVEKNFFEKNIWSVRRKIVPLHPQRGQRDACSMHDSVAQLVEQLTLNQRVEGSSPSGVTLIERDYSTTPYALDVIPLLFVHVLVGNRTQLCGKGQLSRRPVF